ncbi:unnamed protein product [Macrosiphum euphorbiae]|uniref:THAP-type domain-containing protein n=1 Tax=Macrosiphum euphorbiae TaxID=13131 RepID=A0AAV0XY89_9HEMI|nr:unnamed protein product [Macrosiphum euphorbiae]
MSRNCFVPSRKELYPCNRSTNKLLGIRNKTLFEEPKDPKVLTQWIKAIPRSVRNLRPRIDCVCEKHFDETSLIKYFETKMADGSIKKIEKDRILLKENAVPSLFPDLPFYLSSKTKNGKQPDKIENQLKKTILPDATFITKIKDDLIIGWLNNDNDTMFKKIIIYKSNLKIQVFVMLNVEGVMQTATDLGDIEQIIAIVNNLQAYLQLISTIRHRERKQKLKKLKTIGRVKNITRKNRRLNNNVLKLKKKVGLLKQKCATASATVIENELLNFPESQQEAVRACFEAAILKDPKGNRYSINWIYDWLK